MCNSRGLKYRCSGQAILELAIFGALFLMLLGVLLSYGLNYNYNQQMSQYIFRKALVSAHENTPVMAKYQVLRDRHIPDPSEPFARGAATAFMSEAGVISTNKLDESPDKAEDLPKINIDVSSYYPHYDSVHDKNYTVAGFDYDGPNEALKDAKRRYEIVYGAGNFWRISMQNWGDDIGRGDVLDWESGKLLVKRKDFKKFEPPFARFNDWLKKVLPEKHKPMPLDLRQPAFCVEILNYAHGEMIDYDNLIQQCRLILNYDACYTKCTRSGDTDCGEACGKNIETPAYCLGCTIKNGAWYCPKIQEFFFPPRNLAEARAGQKIHTFESGLQGDMKQQNDIQNVLQKNESSTDITTVDDVNWNMRMNRTVIYNKGTNVNTGVGAPEVLERAEEDVSTTVGQKYKRNLQTPW